MGNVYSFNGKTPRIDPSVFVAPTAAIIGDVEIKRGSSVWFGAVIRGDFGPIRIGADTSIQDNAVIHVNHTPTSIMPTIIGDSCTIGHGAIIEGAEIEDHVLVGANSVILPGAFIGRGAIVAALSMAPGNSFEGGQLLAGAPARAKKSLDAPAKALIKFAAEEYAELQAKYRESGFRDVNTREEMTF